MIIICYFYKISLAFKLSVSGRCQCRRNLVDTDLWNQFGSNITENQKKLEEFLKIRLLLIIKTYVFVENCNF